MALMSARSSIYQSVLYVLMSCGNIWPMYLQEEETKSWKKLINIAVSGVAGMISNHLLFKVSVSLIYIMTMLVKHKRLMVMQFSSTELISYASLLPVKFSVQINLLR